MHYASSEILRFKQWGIFFFFQNDILFSIIEPYNCNISAQNMANMKNI